MKKQIKRYIIKALVIAVLLIGAYGLWCHFLTDNVIWKKLKVNGIALQGLTVEEANRALQEDFQEKYESATVTVSFNKKEYSLSIYPVLELDSASVVAEAYSLGHGFWFAHGTDRIQLMNSSGKEELKVMPTVVNADKLEEALEESGLLQAGTTVDTSCRLTDKELIITKGKTGIGPDVDELKKEILNAISEENYNASIECPVMEVKPDDFDMEAYYEEVHTEAQDASLGKNSEIIPAVTGISFNVKTSLSSSILTNFTKISAVAPASSTAR